MGLTMLGITNAREEAWHTSAVAHALPAQMCKLQIQLLVTARVPAFLVSWSYDNARIFQVSVKYRFIQSAKL